MTTQRPTAKQVNDCGDKSTVFNHPAFGVLRVSSPRGRVALFGSDIDHDEWIQLEIAPAEWKRGLNTDWIHGECRPIISVAMSHSQFVSMIQSNGRGEGTPCTIRYAPESMNKSVVQLPRIERLQSKHEMINDEIKEKAQKSVRVASTATKKALESLDDLLNKKSAITKKELGNLRALLNVAESKLGQLPDELQFAVKCAQEAVNKSVHDGKMELEAATENKLRNLGLDCLEIRDPVLPQVVLEKLLDVNSDD